MKVYLDTIGCRLNQSEIESYASQFHAAGHELVGTMAEADIMVVNTCTVTAAAASDSRQKIRQAYKAGIEKIVVTGCLSTLQSEEITDMPGVVQVIPNQEKKSLVSYVLKVEGQIFNPESITRQPVPGSRNRTRAFIKVQDGCNNRCTFCITTLARGDSRSRTEKEVLEDIHLAQRGGVQEVVLTGVHLGAWGHDFDPPHRLVELIDAILEKTDVPRLRVSSLEPWDLDAGFFDLWQDRRLCRHLHLPLQSGSASVLKRMARKTTPDNYAALIEAARTRIPDLAVTTDLIAGFPGETKAEYIEGCEFVEAMSFAGAHVFTYSEREGTAAAEMPDQVHNFTRKERSAVLREITAASAQAFRDSFLGKELDVLWERMNKDGKGNWALTGLTDNYLRVNTQTTQPVWNYITPTILIAVKRNTLEGEITTYPNLSLRMDLLRGESQKH
ncbi:MAG: tRNA (N(6)-L-threonylcarbamoyladenosine(37)-C(2))-methylthiotransferase MtaB [Anaerolineales bacterium]